MGGLLNDYDVLEDNAKIDDIKWGLKNIPNENIIVLYQVWYDIFTQDFLNISYSEKITYLEVFRETFLYKSYSFLYLDEEKLYIILDKSFNQKPRQPNTNFLIDSLIADILMFGDSWITESLYGSNQNTKTMYLKAIHLLLYAQPQTAIMEGILKKGVFRKDYKYHNESLPNKIFMVKSNYNEVKENIQQLVDIKKGID